MLSKGHPIQVAARRTGLSPDILRIWEKRYRAVEPTRTPSGRRLYDEKDLTRLNLLREATRRGWRIHEVAGLDDDRLVQLIEQDRNAESVPAGPTPDPAANIVRARESCVAAVLQLEAVEARTIMTRILLDLGVVRFLDEFLAPVLQDVGTRWESGELQPHQEHLLSAVTIRVLDTIMALAEGITDPMLLVATPSGQRHEIGARMAAATAAASGWGVVYLGPDLPAGDISNAARKRNVRAVALSLVYPEVDGDLGDVLRRISEELPAGVPLIVGGRSSANCAGILEAAHAIRLNDLTSLGLFLNQLGAGFNRRRKT